MAVRFSVRSPLVARAGVALAVLVAAAAVPGAAVAAPAVAPITWAACTEDWLVEYGCATYEVPLDHDRPRGATTTIALARRPADDPARRIGSIFFNPGGPGGEGRSLVSERSGLFPPEVLARFDIIGFDPRGVAASDPIECFSSDAEAEELLAQMRLLPLTQETITSTVRANLAYTESCKRNAGPLLRHMSTVNVAKDLDLLRQAVGDDSLSYLGLSYGTLIGATYANLFPDRVRAIILDGNVDPDQRTNQRLANKFDRAGGFELALRHFLAECDAAGPNCAFAGNARAKLTAIQTRLRQGPVTLPGLGSVSIDLLYGIVYGSLYEVASFPDTAETLQFVYDGITGKATTARPSRAAGAPSLPKVPPARGWLADAYTYNGNDAFYAVNCADAPLPRNPAQYPEIAEAFEAAHPTFGRGEAFGEVGCANWPRTEERYAGPWNADTARTVLVVNPTYDPATRYSFAVRMTRQLGNARLLTLDGFGHTSNHSVCVTNWYTRYLIDGELPPEGTRCAQDLEPFPAG
ncbi:alpha/beta hydrolase [Jidongwangia harbinensis]|uniref:alpha/beta hydrolase n=1 Tax=Jidongwangia harbinensis TaxID=2878561 RepID=UPI001CD9FF19|nr:alpha/beta hydrolase [Jidongwangia harbinensis]MCA2213105.1 alpha/beta hydrolase [Jidongwangia harbinensis]